METTMDKVNEDMPDLWERGTLITTRLSKRAHDRYEQALWYCWGRQDAGDERTKDKRSAHYLGDDFAFAEFAAFEAESFEREHRCSLNCIGDQYKRFMEGLDDQ